MFDHQTSIAVGDALRIIIGIGLALNLGLACTVLGIYFFANRHISRVDSRAAGTLTRYVVSMAASYVTLAIFATAEIQGYYGTVLTYRAPIGFIAMLLGFYGLVNMLLFQDARLDRRDDTVTVEGTPES